MELSNSSLHYTLLEGIIKNGYAPTNQQLAKTFQTDIATIKKALFDLQEYHGVVLHPHEPKVWIIHPFSLAPTNFYVRSARGEWWGNCAWCSLGIAALLKEDVTITTSLGAEGEQVLISILNGVIQETDFVVHFPIAMRKAWDNVVYTCSNMLIFKNEEQVEFWSKKHNISRGDVQPIEKIWAFAQKWYGNHLNPNWEKWTVAEAKAIFEAFDLVHAVWELDTSEDRF